MLVGHAVNSFMFRATVRARLPKGRGISHAENHAVVDPGPGYDLGHDSCEKDVDQRLVELQQ